MFKKVLNAKIHRATVTHADVHYEGSISLPADLLEVANIGQYEAVNVWNVTQGTRFETYTIAGASGTGIISVNGAAAHLVSPGDLVIIASFYYLEPHEAVDFKPTLVFVDENNQIKEIRDEVPGPGEPPKVYRV